MSPGLVTHCETDLIDGPERRSERRPASIDVHGSGVRRHAVAEAAVDAALRGAERAERVTYLDTVSMDRCHELTQDAQSAMGGRDRHPGDSGAGDYCATWQRHVECERPGHADDLASVAGHGEAGEVEECPDLVDVGRAVVDPERPAIDETDLLEVVVGGHAELDGHSPGVWPARAARAAEFVGRGLGA